MTSDLQDKFTESLRRHAEPVSAGPGLAQSAHRRALRLRMRRRIAAGAACLIALAVAIPLGYNLLGGPVRTDIAPAGTNEVRIDVGTLSRGPDPRIPWFQDGAIHDGDRTVPIQGRPGATYSFVPTAGGYLLLDEDNQAFRWVGKDGAVIRSMPNEAIEGLPVVSADGRTLAWTQIVGNGEGSTLVTADAVTGTLLHRKPVPGHVAVAVGFIGDAVVSSEEAPDGGTTRWWEPKTGVFVTVDHVAAAYGTNGRNVLVADSAGSPVEPCLGVFDPTKDSSKLWDKCSLQLALYASSADGKLLAFMSNDESPKIYVFDARTGKLRLTVDGVESVHNMTFEPGGSLLVHGAEGTERFLVRCTLSGTCEAASDPIDERKVPAPVLPGPNN
ncbi:WD40 repeat domain-containing protein [Flindersiella endophytica]